MSFIRELFWILTIEIGYMLLKPFYYDYKLFFQKITDPDYNLNKIGAKAIKVAIVLFWVLVFFKFIIKTK